jgi:hypothetical protein
VSEEEEGEGEGRKAGASVLVFFQGKGGSALFSKNMRGGEGLRFDR